MKKRLPGFTFIEVIVVIAIVVIVVALLMAGVQSARQTAARLGCTNNMHQLGMALHGFHDANGGLPPRDKQRFKNPGASTLLSWLTHILPYVDNEPLWQTSVTACVIDKDTRHVPPHTGYQTVIKAFVCPADGRLLSPLGRPGESEAAFGSYLGTLGELSRGKSGFNGVFGDFPGRRFSDITDGLSNTFMVGERPPPDSLQAGLWYPSGLLVHPPGTGPSEFMAVVPIPLLYDRGCPNMDFKYAAGALSNPCDRFFFWSLHSGGANWLFADGSVRFIAYSQANVIQALSSRNGGEVANLP